MVKELIPSRGAIVEPLLMSVRRSLTADDLARMTETPKTGVPTIQRLRAIHHRQAQLLAEGRKHNEVAAIVGCTPQRITQLLQDPTFIELIGYYRDQYMTAQLEDGRRLQAKLVDLGERAVDELHERMDDDAKRQRMGVDQLRKIGEFAMDRTVAPPKAAPLITAPPTAITINIGAKTLPKDGVPPATVEHAPLKNTITEGNAIPLPGEDGGEDADG